jgi:hypothetical protein
VQNVATWITPKDVEGYPLKRYPQSISEQIMMGIPGLRERVSTEPPGAAHKPQTISQKIRAQKAAVTRKRHKLLQQVP